MLGLKRLNDKNEKELNYNYIVSADIETKDGLLGSDFWLGAICDRNGTYIFKDLDSFMRKLLSYSDRYVIFFHNLNFDGRFIKNWLKKHNIEHKTSYYSGGILKISIRKRKKAYLKIRDSFALVGYSQDKWLEAFNLPHKKAVKWENATEKEVIERVKYDVESLRKLIILTNKMFYRKFGINFFKSETISQLALKLYRKKYMPVDVIPNPYIRSVKGRQYDVKWEIYNFVRESYAGARVEVFDLNEFENVNYYDFNSLYPSVMKDLQLPYAYFTYYPNADIKLLNTLLWKYEGFACVRVRVRKDVKFPILWVKKDGKLIFPTGEFEGTYTFLELREFLRENQGEILECKKIFFAKVSANLFSRFISDLYEERKRLKEQNNPLQFVLKIVMNSSYGKFGQRTETNEIMECESMKEFLTYCQAGAEILDAENLVVSIKRQSYSMFRLVHIASYITAAARIKLYRALKEADKEGIVIYCDTDSIITTAELENSKELGRLKLEYKCKKFRAFAPKVYYMETETEKVYKAKGFPKKWLKENHPESPEEFIDLLKKGYEEWRYVSTKLFFRRKNDIVKKDLYLAYALLKRRLKSQYDKRLVLNDLRTKPVHIII